MRMLTIFALMTLSTAASAADLGPASTPILGPDMEVRVQRPARLVTVRAVSRPCIKCPGNGLPWGGLRKSHAVGLPWGGLPDYCPPVRAVRRAVVVTKG
jgi:hypothetical protein